MRVLCCGSRNWTKVYPIHAYLEGWYAIAMQEHDGELVIIEGCAPGADEAACHWYDGCDLGHATRVGVVHEHFPADWPTCAPDCKPGHRKVNRAGVEYCPTAGHRRNAEMLATGKPDLVLAFTDDLSTSRGTADMIRRAKAAGVPTYVIGRA